MADSTHDVRLIALIIDGVAHSLAVNGKTIIVLTVAFIPVLQSTVQLHGIDTDKNIANSGLAGHDVAAIFKAATETLPSFLAEAFGPIRDSFIATHAA